MSTRPGWYPDPSGRYPKRWYDGQDWTASVLDNSGQQSYDQLPSAGAPAVASLPATALSAPPPPPPSASPPLPPAAVPSPWAPAAPPAPPSSGSASWQPGQSWQSAPSQSAQPYSPTMSGGVWAQQQPVTTASLGLTPPPVVRESSGWGANPLVYGLVALGIAGLVLSMFVLDWYSEGGQSAGFRDFGEGSIISSAPLLDKLAFWNFKWLGFVVAGVALLSVLVFVVARAGSHRVGHVLAAIDVAIGVVLSTFAIVRLGRNLGEDPDVWAWVLPAGYLVLLVAIVISARNDAA